MRRSSAIQLASRVGRVSSQETRGSFLEGTILSNESKEYVPSFRTIGFGRLCVSTPVSHIFRGVSANFSTIGGDGISKVERGVSAQVSITEDVIKSRNKEGVNESGKQMGREAQSSAVKENDEEDHVKSDSLYKILWGVPQPNPEEDDEKEIVWSNISWDVWKKALEKSWIQYSMTWEGFFSNHGATDKEEEVQEQERGDIDFDLDIDELRIRQKKMQKNVADRLGSNLNTIETEGTKFTKFAKQKTGIRNKDDLVKWAGEQIKLATECVNEFMQGYREGRDTEVDKMLNEYFKEFDALQEDTNKQRRPGAENIIQAKVEGESEQKELVVEGGQIIDDRPAQGRRRRKRTIIAR
uniref:Uncharacterized protein n=1 Tax=Odontella aurita TaxID=265563 RepID=A0A7S4MVL0_9STRA|mmetsp:Transcript_35410/g.105750  ORF Transcript_35410/g.105750 Transcript_35410/m.105750 type:complete len:354 (+) Transcript_35410:224-1285(+)|eukprot:CAMPEP_0113559650 /NCGR_PEP_ID=MMETSP0015_2-20120614/19011_1 /TAXON_ID=2838 /ORGANISM="Odontella" /LENGTH=353 /DNA_ID=CAMNT_0000461303 /DNA_START=142 /DNA_END=1203 /DNA_ORIENTATION=- /assembly_acc=CAM_ASM_000160